LGKQIALVQGRTCMRIFRREDMAFPAILDSTQAAEAAERNADFIRQAQEKGGQRRAPVFRGLLADEGLASSLWNGFGRACAFCETPSPGPDSDWVHQFRPVGLAADEEGRTSFMHYVWLSVEWENLYWCCPTCARSKGNRFYTREPRGELGASVDTLRRTEGELFIDPCFAHPMDHIAFAPDGVVAALTETGEHTITVFALNRSDLRKARRSAILDMIEQLSSIRRIEDLSAHLPEGAGRQTVLPYLWDEDHQLKGPSPHAGAATWAMLQWAQAENIPSGDTVEFLDFLLEQDEPTRANLLQAFGQGRMSSDVPVAAKERSRFTFHETPSLPKPNRVLSLHDLPLADALLKSVSIRNFKALKDIGFTLPDRVDDPDLMRSRTLELVPCMLILGENATGKSSVLEALTLALLGTSEIGHLDEMLDDDDLTPAALAHRPDVNNWDILSSDPLSVTLSYQDTDGETVLSATPDNSTFTGNARLSKVLLSYGPRRYFRRGGQRRFRAPAHRVRSQFDPLATIPNPSDWLLTCPDRQFDAAVRALREILMLSDDQEVVRESGAILIDAPGGRTPLSEMSVGYKSVVAMATDIIQELFHYYDNTEFAHAVVLIDEIETHLHPRWKMRIMRLLRLALPKVQFIVTTHDPLCLRGMYDGEVFVLQRSDLDARVETLKDLPNIRGMRAEQLLTSEFFGLGTTDPETDAKLARMHNLAAKEGKSDAEAAELTHLQSDISANMAVGNTVGEQVIVEALRNEGFDPFAPVEKVTGALKKDMLARALRARDTLDRGT
jgi:energy-coupling factor transporter ATP-binding protein EcfA2